jgi:hypothetical protein
MPFFFSYKTFARLLAVAFSSNATPGEAIAISPNSSASEFFGCTPTA